MIALSFALNFASGSGAAAIYFAITQLIQRKRWQWMKLPPPVAASSSTGAEGSSGSDARFRPRASWKRTVFVLVGGYVLAVSLSQLWSLRDESIVEDFHVRQLMLDGHWLPSVMIGLLAPINEEILFRALLFARCVRMLGLPLSLLVQLAYFGVMHDSNTSDKVLMAGWMGVLLSLMYYASGGVLLVPIAIHAANNSMGLLVVLQAGIQSPLLMQQQLEQSKEQESQQERERRKEEVEAAMQMEDLAAEAKRTLVRFKTALGLLRIPEENRAPRLSDGVYTFFQSDVQTLRPEMRQLIGAIFASLEKGGSGYIPPDELAWVMLHRADERIITAAAWALIERRVRVSSTATAADVRTARDSFSVPAQLHLSFFSAEEIASNHARLRALEQAHPSLAALFPSTPLADGKALVEQLTQGVLDQLLAWISQSAVARELEQNTQPLQSQPQEAQLDPSSAAELSLLLKLNCCHAYLNQHARTQAATVAQLSSSSDGSAPIRIPLLAFERYVAHQLLMHPGEGATWLASVHAALLDQENAHPTRELLLRMMFGNGLYDQMQYEANARARKYAVTSKEEEEGEDSNGWSGVRSPISLKSNQQAHDVEGEEKDSSHERATGP
jgi:membrane protease YdiL (CAAX protease family)